MKSNSQVEQNIREIKETLNILLRAYAEGQKFPPQQMSPPPLPSQPDSFSEFANMATPSHPTPTSSSSCDLLSLSNEKNIAIGVIISMAPPRMVVHGHVLLEYECKV